MYPYRVLIVDDEESQREMLSGYLTKKGLRVTTADSGEQAAEILEGNAFEIALLDLKLPGMDGIELLKTVRSVIPDISAIMITAHGDVSSAVEAMKIGAVDYLNKPIDLSELIEIIKKAGERFRILSENRRLKEIIEQPSFSSDFIGESSKIKELLSTVYRVAQAESTVLITGESGTGKELIAGLIHKTSFRANNSFIPVACGALPETLLESELFGHEKGAFTGADRVRMGRFELASGGTLFLDEIGEVSQVVQSKLLRALEENRINRLGSEEFVEIDTRVIAATNRNLSDEVEKGNFRHDLYFRLNTIEIHIPPLRARTEDIKILCEYFINMYASRYKKEIEGVTSEAHDILMHYHWPGNVRELKNVIERGVVLSYGSVIDADAIPKSITGSQKTTALPDGVTTLKDAERHLILQSLERNNWNITGAADELGVHRNTLTNKIREYGIKRDKE